MIDTLDPNTHTSQQCRDRLTRSLGREGKAWYSQTSTQCWHQVQAWTRSGLLKTLGAGSTELGALRQACHRLHLHGASAILAGRW